MANFSIREYHDMLLTYGESRRNSNLAAQIYHHRFPDRRAPTPRTFVAVSQRLLDTGSVVPRYEGRGPERRNDNIEENILNIFDEDPQRSTRNVASELDTSRWRVHRTLREQLLHPYHYQRVQGLLPGDYAPRVRFCRWLLRQHRLDPTFVNRILVTDEACFTRNGVYNSHNAHIWAEENPHAIRQVHFQQRFSVNVWAGMIGDHLIGPFVLPERLTGVTYLRFLQDDLPILMEEVPLYTRSRMWFLHDGAPAHASRIVCEHLRDTFQHRWVGRNAPVNWPARSPDLNPMDFFLWGHMKTIVYEREVNNIDELRARITAAADSIRENQNVFERVRDNWIRRCRVCVEFGGQHIEHLL